LAPGVGGLLEPNPADPDYATTLTDHAQRVALIMQDALIDMGVSDDLAVDLDAVTRVRRIYARAGVTLEESDRMVFLKHVCVGNQADLVGLFTAIRSYDVTEEVVASAAAMFPRHGPRPTVERDLADAAEIEVAV